MGIISQNPYTGETYETYDQMDEVQIEQIIQRAHTARQTWKDVSREQKRGLFHRLADILEKDKEYHAALETKEMGRLFETAKK
jgi:succinate-semialdehyde dehydrogenase/glutarate-semialdehyde dehydrogenase